jgi:hypothetical protein
MSFSNHEKNNEEKGIGRNLDIIPKLDSLHHDKSSNNVEKGEEFVPAKFSSTIRMRKNSGSNNSKSGSVIIVESQDRKLTFNVKNDKQFFDKSNIDNNLKIVKSSANINEKDNLANSTNIIKPDVIEDINKENVPIRVPAIEKLNSIKSSNYNKINIPKIPNFPILNELSKPVSIQVVSNREEKNSQKNLMLLTVTEKDENVKINSNMNHMQSSGVVEDEHLEQIEHPNIFSDENNETQNIRDDLVNQIFGRNNHKINALETDTYQRSSVHESTPATHKQKIILIQSSGNRVKILSKDDAEITRQENDHEVLAHSDSSEFPFRICFICDQFFLKEKTYTTDNCEHSFCRRCGKAYYEEKIEQGEVSFKCPVYKCPHKASIQMIKLLVSEKHFTSIDQKENGEPSYKDTQMNSPNVISFKQKHSLNNFVSVTKMDSIKFYTQKHVIDVNSNESYFLFNKAKEFFCVKCSEPALYGKTGKYIVKCLNCYHTICKFCMKSYCADHFEISSFNYCKVYFRRRLRKIPVKDKKHVKNFLFTWLLFIASFLMICLCVYKYVNVGISKSLCFKRNESNKIKFVFFYFFAFLINIIITPIMLLVIPFFPPLITLLHKGDFR